MSYKTYRRHNCTRRHRTWLVAAKCIWPRSAWIIGEGRYALLAWCDVLTVTLYIYSSDAEAAKLLIDDTGCGGKCRKQHEIVELLDSAKGH